MKNDKKEPTSAPKSNPACISSDSTIKHKLVFRQARIKNQEKHRQSVPCEWDNSLPDPWSTGTTGVGSFGIGISFTGCSTGATGRSYRIFFTERSDIMKTYLVGYLSGPRLTQSRRGLQRRLSCQRRRLTGEASRCGRRPGQKNRPFSEKIFCKIVQ